MNTHRPGPKPNSQPAADPIHPYIMAALAAARAGDLDAMEWLQTDCLSWALIEPNAAILIDRLIRRPAYNASISRQETTGRARRAARGRITTKRLGESHRVTQQ